MKILIEESFIVCDLPLLRIKNQKHPNKSAKNLKTIIRN